jgi:DNA-binding response OmpR family regulator
MHLPGMAGREILRVLRSNPETATMVLIGLSGRVHSKDEATEAFNAGADEYFSKPVDSALLLVRLQSLLRRAPVPAAEVNFRHFGITVYPESRLCRADGKEVRLTRLEFDLLLEFLRNPRRVLTRGGLIDALWSGDSSRGARAVDRHIHALRRKLGECGNHLETLVGVGYRLTSAPARPARPAALTAARS